MTMWRCRPWFDSTWSVSKQFSLAQYGSVLHTWI